MGVFGAYVINLLERRMYTYKAMIKRVVDGDTIDVDVDLGFEIHVIKRIRLADIDAPEVRGKEKVEGKKASEALWKHLYDESTALPSCGLIIKTQKRGGRDKYGRWVAYVWTSDNEAYVEGDEPMDTEGGHSINAWMVRLGYAVWSEG